MPSVAISRGFTTCVCKLPLTPNSFSLYLAGPRGMTTAVGVSTVHCRWGDTLKGVSTNVYGMGQSVAQKLDMIWTTSFELSQYQYTECCHWIKFNAQSLSTSCSHALVCSFVGESTDEAEGDSELVRGRGKGTSKSWSTSTAA